MKSVYLFLLGLLLAFPLCAPSWASSAPDCDKLKTLILQLQLGIKATEDMMEKDTSQNTPKRQAEVAQMKQMLAANQAQFKSMNCAGGQPQLDKTKTGKYATLCGRVQGQIELDQANIKLADRTIQKMTDQAEIDKLKQSRAVFVQDIEKQKQLLVKYGCK